MSILQSIRSRLTQISSLGNDNSERTDDGDTEYEIPSSEIITTDESSTIDTYTNAFDGKILPLMDKIDQVRSLLTTNDYGITFPTVVVVGDQSSGKSTLLEALSLVELPKGSGIVTRCPLVLRLRKSDRRRVYRLDGSKKILLDETSMNLLKYIEDETTKLAGNHKNVVSDLIELQVEDSTLRDLTVVDLPGIARNPIGDQPIDIHKQTTNLIKKFIGQEGSVILCVFPANVDVATVESFALARAVDPNGARTIGVITKTDLAINQDMLIRQLLMDQTDTFHLKLGFVAVRNRSTNEEISLTDARKREKEFFSQHPAASQVESNCLGIDALIDRLANLYAERVRETFPKIQADLAKQLKDVRDQLSKFPPELQSAQTRLVKYHELVTWYVENILQNVFASSNDGKQPSIVNELHRKFGQVEKLMQKQNNEFYSPKYRIRVREAMSACFGEQLPNFLPHPVLKRFINEKIDQFWGLIEVLVDESFQLTGTRLFHNDEEVCNGDILLLKLLPTFRRISSLYLSQKKQLIRDQFKEMIRLEKLEPYTLNHYYMNKINQFREYEAERKAQNSKEKTCFTKASSDKDDEEDNSLFNAISNDDYAAQDMVVSIYAYWKLLIKRCIDNIALSLRAACVFDTCSGIHDRLRQFPTEETTFVDQYLAEDEHIRLKRQRLQKRKVQLETVDAILGDGLSPVHDDGTFSDVLMTNQSSTSMSLDRLVKNLDCA